MAVEVVIDFTVGDIFEGTEGVSSSSEELKSISMTGGVGAGASIGFFSLLGLFLWTSAEDVFVTAPFDAILLGVVSLLLLGVLFIDLDPSVTVLFGEFLAALVRALVSIDLICLLGC